MKRKICVVVTAWPSYTRIKTALESIAAHGQLELQLVLTASALLDRIGDLRAIIDKDGFEVVGRVSMELDGMTPFTSVKTTASGLAELADIFVDLRPDAVVTLADRYETLATAIAASYMNIPLVHVQGGEITGSIDEKVRHAVTKLSDFHFVSTKKSFDRVVKLGEDRDRVFLTGCPSIDLASKILSDPALGFDPFEQCDDLRVTGQLSSGYLVVVQHPVTTEYDQSSSNITETLFAIRNVQLPALWFQPNVDAGADETMRGIKSFRELEIPKNICFSSNMRPTDFLRLVNNSLCIVGNSSVGIRECSFLGVPAVNIGTRQSGRERGLNVVDVDYNRDHIESAIRQQIHVGRFPSEQIYGDGKAGEKIAHLLAEVPLTTEKRLTYD